MFERLKKLFEDGRLTAGMLENAVAKGWITREQAGEILENGAAAKAAESE